MIGICYFLSINLTLNSFRIDISTGKMYRMLNKVWKQDISVLFDHRIQDSSNKDKNDVLFEMLCSSSPVAEAASSWLQNDWHTLFYGRTQNACFPASYIHYHILCHKSAWKQLKCMRKAALAGNSITETPNRMRMGNKRMKPKLIQWRIIYET